MKTLTRLGNWEICYIISMPTYSLESIVKETGADSAAIMAPNEAEGHMFCYASFNMPPEWVTIKNAFDDYTPQGNVQVYKTGKSIIANHLREMLEGYYIESVMIAPIKHKGRTVGTLELIHDRNNKAFTLDNLRKAEAFADSLNLRAQAQSQDIRSGLP